MIFKFQDGVLKKYKDLQLLQRRWFPLLTLDGYILREFLIKYCVLLLVFIILFLLSDVYRDISQFLEARSPWRMTLLYFGYKLPGNIRFVLPISMLLGCMWTMATFGKNMEVTAMRASGVSLFRCGWSILAVGLLVTGVNVAFNEGLVPECEQRAERIFNEYAESRRYERSFLAYRSDDQKRNWLFKIFSGTDQEEDVSIKTVWNRTLVDQLLGKPESPGFAERFEQIFGSKADRIREAVNLEERIDFELIGRKIDLYASRVVYDRDKGCWTFFDGSFVSYDRGVSSFEASSGTSLVHPRIPYQSIAFTPEDIPESPRDIMNAVKEKDELATPIIWEILHSNANLSEPARAVYWTVFFYRIAFPWSCFLAVFLGIPLATRNERTGSLLAVISAVVIIVVYIVVAQVFLVLGKGGFVNPAIAGLAPTLLFIAYGVWRVTCDRN